MLLDKLVEMLHHKGDRLVSVKEHDFFTKEEVLEDQVSHWQKLSPEQLEKKRLTAELMRKAAQGDGELFVYIDEVTGEYDFSYKSPELVVLVTDNFTLICEAAVPGEIAEKMALQIERDYGF